MSAPVVRTLTRVTWKQVAETLLLGADPHSLFGMASLRIGPTGTYPRALFPVPIRSWREILPAVMSHQRSETVFWNMTTFKPAACRIAKPFWTGEPVYFKAAKQFAHALLAIIIDLDVGRGNTISAHDAERIILELCQHQEVPEPTFLSRTGRGLNLQYVLAAHAGLSRTPPPMTHDVFHVRREIVLMLMRAFEAFAPDDASLNAVQFFKAPDTRDGLVSVHMSTDSPRYWTLDEMITFSALQRFRTPAAGRRSPSIRRSRRRRHSRLQYVAPSRARLREMKVVAARRGIASGMRNKAMLYFVDALRRVACSELKDATRVELRVLEEARAFNEILQPPLDAGEFAKALRSQSPKPHRNETVVRTLRITREEALTLALKYLVPAALKAERSEAALARRRTKATKQSRCDELLMKGLSPAVVARVLSIPSSTVRSRAARLRAAKCL